MDVGVVSIRSKKQRRQQEQALLVAEAKKSVADPVTGKIRCLSCGHILRSLPALADHLRKHDGVNSTDYQHPRIVGTSSKVFGSHAAQRLAAMQLHEVMNVALQTGPSRQSEKKEPVNSSQATIGLSLKHETRKGSQETKSRKKNKMTPMKRQILIEQVLSLTAQLQSLNEDRIAMSDQHQSTDSAYRALKKEAKKLQGCINSTACELQMALTMINRKFTFRQLVMIEYLTDHMKLMGSTLSGDTVPMNSLTDEGDPNDDAYNYNSTMMKQETDNNILEIYEEIDMLAQEIFDSCESLQSQKEKGYLTKNIKPRRDTASEKIFIRKPVFADSTFMPHAVDNDPLRHVTEPKEEEKGIRESAEIAETIEQDLQNLSKEDGLDPFLLSSETSSDEGNEMLGFSDVLAEWAKQTQYMIKETKPAVSHFFQAIVQDNDPGITQPDALAGLCNLSDDKQNSEVHVIHIRRSGGETALPDESDEKPSLQSRCIFIRPHLMTFSGNLESKHPSSHTQQREKSTKKKKQPFSPAEPWGSTASPKTTTDTTPSTNLPPQPPETLDKAVHALISRLNALQHIHMKTNNGEPPRKWIISGFAEVGRYLEKEGAVKLIIAANNLDVAIQPKLDKLRLAAEEQHVPIVVALNRRKIGQIYHPCKRMAVVAVLDNHDALDIFETILHLSQKNDHHH